MIHPLPLNYEIIHPWMPRSLHDNGRSDRGSKALLAGTKQSQLGTACDVMGVSIHDRQIVFEALTYTGKCIHSK